MEVLVLLMVCAAPWAYGAVHPGFQFLLNVGVGLLLFLWAGRMLLEGHLRWAACPVALCLAGLFLLGVLQLTPLAPQLLRCLSPTTASLYDQLLPVTPEVLPFAVTPVSSIPPAGSTLSVYAYATQSELSRLLALFLVFAAVRNNIVSSASLRRLSIACLANGAGLCLFALIQFFSADEHTLYWTYPALGQVFGPFINRNHFAFYINMCIGLGAGLLLRQALVHGDLLQPAGSGTGPDWPLHASVRALLARVVQEPILLWICAGLTLMLCGVALCLSRGGLLALAGGFLLFACLGRRREPKSMRFGRFAAALLTVTAALALTSWLGVNLLKTRLATFWEGGALDDRAPLWRRAAAIACDFPVTGTGYGTFTCIENLYRSDAKGPPSALEHAHNEYLELLAEAGLPALVLALFAIGTIYWLGWRAVRQRQASPAAGLLAGGLFAFTTVVIHSFGEFGLHVPALALLVTVIVAQLCGAERGPGATDDSDLAPRRARHETASARVTSAGGFASPKALPGAGEYRFRLWGLAPVIGAAACIALGIVLCVASWKTHVADRLATAAAGIESDEKPLDLRRRIALLQGACALLPADAEFQLRLGDARLASFEREHALLHRHGTVLAVVATLAGSAVGSLGESAGPTLTAVRLWALLPPARRHVDAAAEEQLIRAQLVPALRCYLRARDASPLLSGPHLRIAESVNRFDQADSQATYLERVKLVAPCLPRVWYICGLQELLQGRAEQAWLSWRRSLELSDAYLPQIVKTSGAVLSPAAMVEKVLPDRPDVLVAAVSLPDTLPNTDAAAQSQRRPALEKALRLLLAKTEPLAPKDLHTRALAHAGLQQRVEASAAYRALLALEPRQVETRQEFARLLYDMGHLEDARGQLTVILAQQPRHGPAQALLALVANDLARKR